MTRITWPGLWYFRRLGWQIATTPAALIAEKSSRDGRSIRIIAAHTEAEMITKLASVEAEPR